MILIYSTGDVKHRVEEMGGVCGSWSTVAGHVVAVPVVVVGVMVAPVVGTPLCPSWKK